MACERCEELAFNFTEELGDFVMLNQMYFEQLTNEPDQDNLTETGYKLMTARMESGIKLFEVLTQIADLGASGHFREGDARAMVQLELFGKTKPSMDS